MPQWEQGSQARSFSVLWHYVGNLPLTGWLLVSASPTNIPTVLFGVVPFPHLPFDC